jgi:hypothetical protein
VSLRLYSGSRSSSAGWTIVSYPCGNRLPGRCERGVSPGFSQRTTQAWPLCPLVQMSRCCSSNSRS